MVSQHKARLTQEQIRQYDELGYVTSLSLFGKDETCELQEKYEEITALLPPELPVSRVNWWHKKNKYLYERVCTDSRLLDYVECLLGPNFFLWGSQFFVKEPGDGTIIPWHQDAQYWPLTPMKAVTAFIAFGDCDRENACMRILPGTHREPLREHRHAGKDHYILQEEILPNAIEEDQAVYLELKAGQMSLHDDAIAHGSGPNNSDRRRVGFTMRFSSTDVKCDLNVWPTFAAHLVRGVDEYNYNPVGKIPTEFDAPDCMRPE
ncbi:MAG: phytanoyl-CoA dioxygenase family protein [Planctomycetes bacterium]|nr:phytanoyl-CoA dioxygenase family protein [Planctomycetota bacterium]